MTNHYEIRNAVGNRGQDSYLVAAVEVCAWGDRWAATHMFSTKGEAVAWCKAQVEPYEDRSI